MREPWFAEDGNVENHSTGEVIRCRGNEGGANHLRAVQIADLLNADYAATVAARQPASKKAAA